FETMGKGTFIAGKTSEISTLGAECGIRVVDFLGREDMAVQNAIPTAEGAIQIAMEKTPYTLNGSNILILGYGRVGKYLARMLAGIGAKVWVTARKFSDLAWIESMGYNPVTYNELREKLGIMDIIFNTVPCMVLGESELRRVNRSCLIIDLASKPGGVNFKCAEELGINTIWALSLPGKVAPVTAARIMKNTIYNIIEESRVQNAF
ncbi:MAG TPA: NAD(P)-dependent oxidoreductase, partial [Clostridia bacterium]|nr:NAD(P)-dependent oxidoreductase [Clostridia bacterium]